jgi:hypothetical protein
VCTGRRLGLSYFPLYTAVATAAAVLAMFFQLYLMAVVMAL